MSGVHADHLKLQNSNISISQKNLPEIANPAGLITSTIDLRLPYKAIEHTD